MSEGKMVKEATNVLRMLRVIRSQTESSFTGAAKKEQEPDEEQDEVDEPDLIAQVMFLREELVTLKRRSENYMPQSLVDSRLKDMRKELQEVFATQLSAVREELMIDFSDLHDNHKKQAERKLKASEDKMNDDLEAAKNDTIKLCKEQDKRNQVALSEFKDEMNLWMDKNITSMTAMHKESSDKQKAALTTHISQIEVQMEVNMSQTGIKTAEYEARMGKLALDMKQNLVEYRKECEQDVCEMKQTAEATTKKFMQTFTDMAKANNDTAQQRVITDVRRSIEPHAATRAHATSLSRRSALPLAQDGRRGTHGSSPRQGSDTCLSDEEGSHQIQKLITSATERGGIGQWIDDAEHVNALEMLRMQQLSSRDNEYHQQSKLEATLMQVDFGEQMQRIVGGSVSGRHNSVRGEQTTLREVDFGAAMQRSVSGSVSGRRSATVRQSSAASSIRGDPIQ